jgi:small-conductance mechanosensitive channel
LPPDGRISSVKPRFSTLGPQGLGLVLLLFSLLTGPVPPSLAADEPGISSAPVVVDGVTLFRIRGVLAYPADERARGIAERIRAVARDASVPADAIRIVATDRSNDILMGDHLLMSVFKADAEMEGTDRPDLANLYARRIRVAVEAYRRDRSLRHLAVATGTSLAATAVLVGVALLMVWLWRRVNVALERRYGRRLQALEVQSGRILQAEQLREIVQAGLRALRVLAILVVTYLYLSFVLARFPWTRPTAARLLGYVISPLETIGVAFVQSLPNLIFLAVLVVVTRYGLKLLALVFTGLERGTIRFAGFERDWAAPTYRIVRIAVIGFAVVVAYPYIPGSESAAFKGMSLFFGLLFSLGASSVVANTMAGYSLIYRRTFAVGDRVKINDVVGDVTEMRLQVTHLRTIKNEDVIIPNSVILTSQVVNYSSYAARDGLILHTTVGIGYEVPWRQVEAMLLMAAGRTPGLRTQPPPFVLQTSLGDFAVSYELNVYCDDTHAMATLYAALHRSVQDVFNEYGVQIMTPAYRADPPLPKVVPKDRWHDAPAPAPEEPPETAAR